VVKEFRQKAASQWADCFTEDNVG